MSAMDLDLAVACDRLIAAEVRLSAWNRYEVRMWLRAHKNGLELRALDEPMKTTIYHEIVLGMAPPPKDEPPALPSPAKPPAPAPPTIVTCSAYPCTRTATKCPVGGCRRCFEHCNHRAIEDV